MKDYLQYIYTVFVDHDILQLHSYPQYLVRMHVTSETQIPSTWPVKKYFVDFILNFRC